MNLEDLLRNGEYVEGAVGEQGYVRYTCSVESVDNATNRCVVIRAQEQSDSGEILLRRLISRFLAIPAISVNQHVKICEVNPIRLAINNTGIKILKAHFINDHQIQSFLNRALTPMEIIDLSSPPSGDAAAARLTNDKAKYAQIGTIGLTITETMASKTNAIDQFAALISNELNDETKNELKKRCFARIEQMFQSMTDLNEIVTLFNHLITRQFMLDNHKNPKRDAFTLIWNTEAWQKLITNIQNHAVKLIKPHLNAYERKHEYSAAVEYLTPFSTSKLFNHKTGNGLWSFWSPPSSDFIKERAAHFRCLEEGTTLLSQITNVFNRRF